MNKRLLDPKILSRFTNLYLLAKTGVEGFISGLHRGLYKGFSIEFYEHREYVPGDDIKYIDWKVYGRTDRLFLKTFKEEINLKCYIILDTSNSMKFSTSSISKLQYGIYLSALLSYLMINQRDAVGLITFDKKVRNFISASSKKSHLYYLLDVLEKVKPEGETSIKDVIENILPAIKKRSLIIFISDFFDNPEETARGILHFKHKHHEVICFQILDPAEVKFNYSGICEFFDLENGKKISVNATSIRREYQKLFNNFLDYLKKTFIKSDIDYVFSKTDTPFDIFLYNYLKIRNRTK